MRPGCAHLGACRTCAATVGQLRRRIADLEPRPAATARRPLTDVELRTVALAADGLTYDQIAAHLFVAASTVKGNLARAAHAAGLGSANTTALVALALRHRWIR